VTTNRRFWAGLAIVVAIFAFGCYCGFGARDAEVRDRDARLALTRTACINAYVDGKGTTELWTTCLPAFDYDTNAFQQAIERRSAG